MSRVCCGPDEVPDTAETIGVTQVETLPVWWRDWSLRLPAASGALLVVGYLAGWAGADRVELGLHVLALAAGAWTFAPAALRHLARGFLGVGLLMTIAAVGAVILGHVGEAAALAFLFSIAEALEDRAMDRAKHGLGALLALMPSTARVEGLVGTRTVPAAEVAVGDVLVVGGGERVATDGTVVDGRSSLDTSAITGESIPVEVGPQDQVLAGSVNGIGTLRIRATAAGTDNSITTIVRLVQEAHRLKGDRARLADRIARPLVPLVLVTAALVAGVGSLLGDPSVWIERALVVLVAASPCALAIAVPVTVISAIGSASKLGVIIKSGAAFEQLGTIGQVALDKTGTLTRNQPRVVGIEVVGGADADDALRVAAGLEASSTHPLASAIVLAADNAPTAIDVVEQPGQGLLGTIDGRAYRVGSPRWIAPGALQDATERMADSGMSVVVVERDGQPMGAIGVRDELRPEAAAAIDALRVAGIGTVMVTGDNHRTARALADQAGISDVRAEQLPQDKASAVAQMTLDRPTAMIGDGVNDAPALATATVGIAMGATGSAAALESADVAFTGHDLRQIPAAIEHARRGRAIMTSNIVLALAIIVVLFPLALLGVLGLAGVVLVHELAEVVVILNGLRAARLGTKAGALTSSPKTIAPPDTSDSMNGHAACGDHCCAPAPAASPKPLGLLSRGERR
jgi:cation-transporting ATPase G